MKVLLVDDHPLILSALQAVIEGLREGVQVVGVEDADQAHAALAKDDDFDLVLLDLALGEVDGFEVLVGLRERYPALPVVVISATERHADVIRAVDLGAMGFVPKRTSNRELTDALAMVMSGGVYLPPAIVGLPAGGADGLRVAEPAPAGSIADLSRLGPHQQARRHIDSIGLTPRQNQVLSLLLQGLPNKLIAREMKVSVETVKDHVAAVLQALGVSSRTQAVLAVSQMNQGLVGGAGGAGGAVGTGYPTRQPQSR